jgi:hypothetical protein
MMMMGLYKLSMSAGQCKEKQTMISEMNAKRPIHSKLHRALKKMLFVLLLHMWNRRYISSSRSKKPGSPSARLRPTITTCGVRRLRNAAF